VPQALPPALTCFLRGLLTLYVSPGRNDMDENGVDRGRVKVVKDSGDGETVTLF
jgi:hypothetical protein